MQLFIIPQLFTACDYKIKRYINHCLKIKYLQFSYIINHNINQRDTTWWNYAFATLALIILSTQLSPFKTSIVHVWCRSPKRVQKYGHTKSTTISLCYFKKVLGFLQQTPASFWTDGILYCSHVSREPYLDTPTIQKHRVFSISNLTNPTSWIYRIGWRILSEERLIWSKLRLVWIHNWIDEPQLARIRYDPKMKFVDENINDSRMLRLLQAKSLKFFIKLD